MQDIHTLNYRIEDFDEPNMVVFVKFDDYGKMAIQLPAPLPTTEEEMAQVLSRYVPTVEMLEIATAKSDLSFVRRMVGRKFSTPRHSTRREAEKLKNELQLNQTAAAPESTAADDAYLRAMIKQVLAEERAAAPKGK